MTRKMLRIFRVTVLTLRFARVNGEVEDARS